MQITTNHLKLPNKYLLEFLSHTYLKSRVKREREFSTSWFATSQTAAKPRAGLEQRQEEPEATWVAATQVLELSPARSQAHGRGAAADPD